MQFELHFLMRIISPFKDYYDSVLAHGFEDSQLFMRKSVFYEADLPKKLPPHLDALACWSSACADVNYLSGASRDNPDSKGRRFTSVPIAFSVGMRAFKGLWVSITEPEPAYGPLDESSRYDNFESYLFGQTKTQKLPPSLPFLRTGRRLCFHGPVFDAASFELLLPEWVNWARDKKNKDRGRRVFSRFDEAVHHGILGQLEWIERRTPPPDLTALMTAASCPIAVASRPNCAIESPCLSDFQFFRALSPALCMQEIAMFVSNLSNPERPSVQIADRYKIVEHGFDEQSFRKQPTKGARPQLPKRPHPDRRSC